MQIEQIEQKIKQGKKEVSEKAKNILERMEWDLRLNISLDDKAVSIKDDVLENIDQLRGMADDLEKEIDKLSDLVELEDDLEDLKKEELEEETKK